MVLSQLCGRIKIILLGLIGAFRRALCCFSRRRKPSDSECDILQSVNVINDTGKTTQGLERDWNSWDDSPRTVQEHIEQYRQKLVRPPTPPEAEPEPDFFQDMTPKIKPQARILIDTNPAPAQTDFSRLKATTDVPIPIAADLQDWNEEEPVGWEEFDPETTNKLIREKRKEMRAQKQARQLHFAERIGTRIS